MHGATLEKKRKKFLLRPPQIPDGRYLQRNVCRTFYINILCFYAIKKNWSMSKNF
jgi:hypothetical protein